MFECDIVPKDIQSAICLVIMKVEGTIYTDITVILLLLMVNTLVPFCVLYAIDSPYQVLQRLLCPACHVVPL